jgi:hypothetical protein
MEYYPGLPFEAPNPPELPGDAEGSKKKKKKSTRIPLPLAKPELEAVKAEDTTETKEAPKGLEALFGTREDHVSPDTNETPLLPDTEKGEPDEALVTREADVWFSRSEASDTAHVPEAKDIDATTFEADIPADDHRTEAVHEPETPHLEIPIEESLAPKIEEDVLVPPAPLSTGEDVVPERLEYEPMDSEPATRSEREMIDPSHRTPELVTDRPEITTAPSVKKKEVEAAYHRGQKRGVSRGVASGALFGWWLGRRGKKAAEAKLAETSQTVKKQEKLIKKLSFEQQAVNKRMEAIRLTQEHIERTARTETAPMVGPEATSPSAQEVRRTIAPSPETVLANKRPDRIATPKQAVPERAPEQEESATAPEHRVEASAWHTYEVDKTGKLVENSEITYGEEFRKEQRQELLRKKLHEEKVAASVGSTVLLSAGTRPNQSLLASNAASSGGGKKTSGIKGVLGDRAFIAKQLVQRTTNPATWIIAVVIVVLLFVIGVLR